MITSSKTSLKTTALAKPQKEICSENYLKHPTFGLLTRVCRLEENLELFTTLYAQRFFFLVSSHPGSINFEPIGRTDACFRVENRLKHLRRTNQTQEYDKLFAMYKLSLRWKMRLKDSWEDVSLSPKRAVISGCF